MAKSPQDKADAQFKKAQQAIDGAAAMAQYEAEAHATREKTARLRALRLAKEEADAAEAASKPATGKKKTAAKSKTANSKTAKSKKDKGVPLSDWLSSEQGAGRRS